MSHQASVIAAVTLPSIAADAAAAAAAEGEDHPGSAKDVEVGAHVSDPAKSPEQDQGVANIEALYDVAAHGKWFWALWISLVVGAYAYSLSQSTTPLYTQFATSSYGDHSLLGLIGTITAIMSGVILPFVAKIADLFSRPTALFIGVVLYAIGLAIIAGSKSVQAVAAGQVISSIGSVNIYFMQGLVVADITSIRWRGAVQGLLSLPFVINAFVAGDIVTKIGAFSVDGWRWGYGMFCIIVPVTLIPVLVVLFAGDRKARAMRGPAPIIETPQPLGQRALQHWHRINGLGLLLLGFAFVLVLAPLTLGGTADGGYKNPSLIAMFVVGGLCLFAWAAWDLRFARYPLMPRRIFNRTYLACVAVGFIYYLAYFSVMTYLSSWVYVVKDFSDAHYTYFSSIPNVGLCLFSAPAGLIHAYTRRYKYQQLIGIGVLCIGSGLNYAASKNPTDGVLIGGQIIYSLGSAMVMLSTGIGSQGSVPHQDLAMAIAIIAFWSQVAGGIGSAVASSIWNRVLPEKLELYLGDTHNATEIADIFGSILVAKISEPRELVIRAYNETMTILATVSLGIIFLAVIAGMFAKNFVLTDAQNVVEEDKIIRIGRKQQLAEEDRESL